MAFPTTLPSYTITAGSETANGAGGGTGLSGLLNAFEVDVTAIGTKMGTGASTPTANKVLRGNGTGTSVWGAVVLTTDVSGILPLANGGTGGTTSTGSGALVFAASPTITSPTLTSPAITSPTIQSWDGWITTTDTWAWVSATSFKVAGKDVTALFPKGTKIKLTNNGGTQYYYVINTAFSTDTTVTIAAGSDYTLVNSAITNPFYSYQTSPQGFPDWFTWQPSYTNLTVGTGPTQTFQFRVTGQMVFCKVKLVFGTGGSVTAGDPTFTIPINSDGSYIPFQPLGQGGCSLTTGGGGSFNLTFAMNTTTAATLNCINAAGTNAAVAQVNATVPLTWAAGSVFSGTLEYRMA